MDRELDHEASDEAGCHSGFGSTIGEFSSFEVLGEDGLFAKKIEKFSPRKSQIEMANEIDEAIISKSTLVAESGTGTGKTFAYLVPVMLSGKKTMISTGTKHLQEQLFHRDIPVVADALRVGIKTALLKGRSNYLCIHRHQQTRASSRRFDNKTLSELESISSWIAHSRSGDIGEQSEVPEDSKVWPQVTSTADNCLGQECSHFEDCYVNKARKTAMASDLVVVNHHLFFADKALKDDGFGALLPEVDTVVFDEAHQIPDIASNFLGISFSSWQVFELTNDVRAAELKERSLIANLIPLADQMDKQVSDYRLALGLAERRLSWDELIQEITNFPKKMTLLAEKLDEFADLLESAAAAGEALGRCHERAIELRRLCVQVSGIEESSDAIRWVELAKRSFRIHETPLHIGDHLNAYFGNQSQARIFTSATLSIDGDFQHFRQLVGLSENAKSLAWDSPFDYFEQAVLYVPEGLPSPKEDGFSKALFDSVYPIINASHGRAFVLFTSFRIMQEFEERLASTDSGLKTLMQGESNKTDLLTQFIGAKNAVLLGTMSFWEGVDVPGDALRTVVIDKLPFESPFDPVIKARLNAMHEMGDNPFMNYQVPKAVITLRQGAGRLIRSQQDKGVLMICDARLRTTHYGKKFLNSLPRMRRTSDQHKVCGFLESISATDD